MQSFMNLPVSSRIGVMGLPPLHGYGVVVQLYLPIVSLAVIDPHVAPVIPTSGNLLDYA